MDAADASSSKGTNRTLGRFGPLLWWFPTRTIDALDLTTCSAFFGTFSKHIASSSTPTCSFDGCRVYKVIILIRLYVVFGLATGSYGSERPRYTMNMMITLFLQCLPNIDINSWPDFISGKVFRALS